MTPFWTFLTFSLLSYIEIYIEYREKASGSCGKFADVDRSASWLPAGHWDVKQGRARYSEV